MRSFKATVYFQDQVPRIGCGWRTIIVQIGRQWLRFEECSTGRRAKLRRFPLDGRTMTRFDQLERLKFRTTNAEGYLADMDERQSADSSR